MTSITIQNAYNKLLYASKNTTMPTLSAVADDFRNRIVNSRFLIDQRNVGAPVSITQNGIATGPDRWNAQVFPGIGTFPFAYRIEQSNVSDATVNALGFSKSLKFTCDSNVFFQDQYAFVGVEHAIEIYDISDFGWGATNASTATLSFWARGTSNMHWVSLANPSLNCSFVQTFNLTPDSWSNVKVSIPAPPVASTWPASNTAFAYLGIDMQRLYNPHSNMGNWVADHCVTPSNADFALWNQAGNFVEITGVQLSKGSNFTSFQARPFDAELRQCQRTYEKSFPFDVAPANDTSNVAVGNMMYMSADGLATGTVPFKTPKVSDYPVVNFYNPFNAAGTVTDGTNHITNGVSTLRATKNGFSLGACTSTLTSKVNYFNWTADAEPREYYPNPTAGTVLWIAKMQSSGTGGDIFLGICSTADGVVAAGYYDSTGTLTAKNADSSNFATVLPASATGIESFLAKYSLSGSVQWVAKMISSRTGSDQFEGVCSTSDGGIVAAGYYDSTGTLTAQNANLTNFATLLPSSRRGIDPFLVKYTSSGGVEWIAKILSSSTGNDYFYGVCSTSDGGIVAAGYYDSTGTLTAQNADLTNFATLLPASNTNLDAFLVKYNSSGKVQWIAKTWSIGQDLFFGVCSIPDGGIVAAGYFSGSELTSQNANLTNFATLIPASSTSYDPFLVKYNLSGEVQWHAKMASSSTGFDRFYAVCSTLDGGIVGAGYYDSSGTLTAQNANLTNFATVLPASARGDDSFLVKYSSSGMVQWIAKMLSSSTGADYYQGVCSTIDGGVAAVGYYPSTGTLTARNANSTNFATVLPASNTGSDAFIVKYSSSGTVKWITKMVSSTASNDWFYGVCLTADGGIVAAGYYNSADTLIARHATGESFGMMFPASNTGADSILVKYSDSSAATVASTRPNGTVQWVAKMQSSSTGTDQFKAVCSTPDGGVVAAGYYDSTGTLTAQNANLTNFATVLPASATGEDSFLVKYSLSGTVQWISKMVSSSTGNDQVNYHGICSTADGGLAAVGVYDSTGTLTAQNANLSNFATVLPASATGLDPFLVKYNSSCTVQWIAKMVSSSTGSDYFNQVCSTQDGGIVAAGYYDSAGTLTAQNANLTNFATVLPAPSRSVDAFLVKYNLSGSVLWVAKTVSSAANIDYFNGVCSTTDGGIVAAGVYASAGTLTAQNANLSNFATVLPASARAYEALLVKYNLSGNVQWVAKTTSSTAVWDFFNGVCATADGGIAAAGRYDSAGTLTAQNANLSNFATVLPASATGYDPFIAKYNSSGNVQWIAKALSSSTGEDIFSDVCSTVDGGIVVAGYYASAGTLTVQNSTLANFTTVLPASNTGTDPFIAKYGSFGTVQWVAKLVSSSTGNDQFVSVCSTVDGGVVAAGYYDSAGTLTAQNSTLTNFATLLPASATGTEAFLVKYF